jgi:ABC-2 type transport system ATP-binding protein
VALGERLGATVVEDSPGEYRVDVAPSPATVASLTAWLAEHDLPLADLRAGRQRLEDVFLRLTREAAEPDDATVTGGRSARRGRGRRARR